VVADIARLPFADKSFDYVYCSHVLEHADDPLAVCRELVRIGKRGYIETPTLAKDALFAWHDSPHKWHVVAIGEMLCFFEYSKRQREGTRSAAWRDILFDKWWHPLQDLFDRNQDLFNVMFVWSGAFNVMVCHLDGRVERLMQHDASPSAELMAAAR
jgi:ubiquinone/menaquinone biosynthesis C-methylase UbiE